MKRFAAGVVVGAALGVAATLAATRRDDVAPPPRAHDAAAPDAGSAPETTPARRGAATRAPDAPSEAPPSTAPATEPALARFDAATASLDELVAAIRGPIDDSGKLPGGWSPARFCGEIARRFPGFRYPPDLVMHLVAMAKHENGGLDAFDGAVATWTDDFALAEFERVCAPATPTTGTSSKRSAACCAPAAAGFVRTRAPRCCATRASPCGSSA
jgi:hypothetical protein